MSINDYPSMEGIEFSDDDRLFIADQAEKLDLLKAFVVLLAGGSAGLSMIGSRINDGKDLGEYLVDRAVDIATDNWGDASGHLLSIRYSVAIGDINLHLFGRYTVDEKTLDAPKGKAKQFFKQLAQYYVDMRSNL